MSDHPPIVFCLRCGGGPVLAPHCQICGTPRDGEQWMRGGRTRRIGPVPGKPSTIPFRLEDHPLKMIIVPHAEPTIDDAGVIRVPYPEPTLDDAGGLFFAMMLIDFVLEDGDPRTFPARTRFVMGQLEPPFVPLEPPRKGKHL